MFNLQDTTLLILHINERLVKERVIVTEFKGFTGPEQNWTKLPHEFIDRLPEMSSLAEVKSIMYVLRHTWGYAEVEAWQAKLITTDEFLHGRKRRDGSRIDGGIGMSKPSLYRGLSAAIDGNFLVKYVDNTDLGRVTHYFRLRSPDDTISIIYAMDPNRAGESPWQNLSNEIRQAVYARFQGRCAYCEDKSRKWHYDHIVPQSQGGPDVFENIALACPRCNMTKHNRTPDEWGRPVIYYEADEKIFYSDWRQFLSGGVKKRYPPMSQNVTPPCNETLPRTEKETLERNLKDIPLEKKSSGLSPKTQTDTTDPLVSVFDSDGGVIPEMREILVAMSVDGLVDHRTYKEQPDWSFFHWIDNDLPVKNIPYGIAEKYGYKPPESVLVDTPAPYVVDEQTQAALGPDPQSLARYAVDVARSAAETLDAEIVGDELADVFGPNDRQAEIDTYQAKDRQPLDPDALLLGAMVGPVSAAVRSKLTQMRSQGWKVKDGEIELALAQFFEITQFVMPTSKSRRKFFVASVREHMQEELFSGRVGELYETVWDKISPDVKAGDLEITSPKSLTSFMYGVLNREEGPVSELTRGQLIDRLTDDNLVEVKEKNGSIWFVWVETGKRVGEIPTEITARYSRAGSSK